MLRKFLASMLIAAMCVTQSSIVFGDYSSTEYLRVKTQLLQTDNGSQYVSELEAIIPELSESRLESILEKVSLARETLSPEKYADTFVLIDFITLLIEDEFAKRARVENISPEIKSAAEAEIMSLQKLMKQDILNTLDDLMIAWNDASRYEEKGDLEMDMMLDIDGVTKMSGEFSLLDYTAETQGFDQTFMGKIDTLFNATTDGEEVSISLSSNMDIISKDGQLYLKMHGITYSDNGGEDSLILEISPYIDQLEELAKDNTYLSFGDTDAQIAYETLKAFSADSLDQEIDAIFDSALLEAYNMTEDGTYLLRPTKHFCDTGKDLMSVFDPFGGNTCTDGQYENMLRDYHESGIVLEMKQEKGNNTLTWKMEESTANFDMTLTWTKTRFSELDLVVTGAGYSEGNLFTMNYIPKRHFKSHLSIVEDEMVEANFLATLTRNGGIKEISGDFDLKDGEDTVTAKLSYKGFKLDMSAQADIDDMKLDCSLAGRLDSVYADLEGNCVIQSDILTFIIPNTHTLTMNMDMEYDIRSGKNNANLNFNALANENKIFDMNIKNVGTRTKVAPRTIQAPEKVKSITDLILESYGSSGEFMIEEAEDYNFDSD